MAEYFFPSCKVVGDFKNESDRLAKYMKKRFGLDPIGCCRPNYSKLEENDKAYVLCNNCAAILEESSKSGNINYVWELIDNDPDFEFPNYRGEAMVVQDCWIAVERRNVQETVRSLMKKMNIDIVELEENFGKTTFCGPNLLSKCNPSNAKLAPKRYENGNSSMFRPMEDAQKKEFFMKYAAKIKTDKAVCYCKYCRDGINMGEKQGLHIIQLLFPEKEVNSVG